MTQVSLSPSWPGKSRAALRMLRPRILLFLLGAGIAIASVLAVSRRPVMTLLFGHQFLPAAVSCCYCWPGPYRSIS